MKRIGLVGGLGPEATVDYYRRIIERSRAQTKGKVPEIILYSLDMRDFPRLERRDEVIGWFRDAILALHGAGADFAAIAANTPHFIFDELKAVSPIPLISIVEETCRKALEMKLQKVGLLGTKVTMSADFYPRVFAAHGISIIVPNEQEKDYIDQKLFREIMYNRIVKETRQALLSIISRMTEEEGIEAAILGCTELPLILASGSLGIPFLNTTEIHVESIVSYCLSGM